MKKSFFRDYNWIEFSHFKGRNLLQFYRYTIFKRSCIIHTSPNQSSMNINEHRALSNTPVNLQIHSELIQFEYETIIARNGLIFNLTAFPVTDSPFVSDASRYIFTSLIPFRLSVISCS